MNISKKIVESMAVDGEWCDKSIASCFIDINDVDGVWQVQITTEFKNGSQVKEFIALTNPELYGVMPYMAQIAVHEWLVKNRSAKYGSCQTKVVPFTAAAWRDCVDGIV